MALGKTRGPDGLRVEFYPRCWNIIGADFTEVISDIHNSGQVPDFVKLGYTKLYTKKNSKTDLKNYRPISLLNCDLKIYMKCLANRLKPILGTCLQTHQYATPDKSATDALKRLRNIFYYVKFKHIDGYFISLDFEKAFDTVNHDWLEKTMVKLGFSQHFVKITKSLNCNVKCQVIVNGNFTEQICLRLGVRQGDPLSLYLFLISIEPLVSKLTS